VLRTVIKVAAPVARALGQVAGPAVKKVATEAGERVVPTAEEIGRTRELFNVVDDRLAASLKGVTDGMARMEAQIVRLEGKMEAQIVRLEGKMEAQVVRLEGKMDAQIARLEERMDKFATKESVKEGFQHMETRLKYYLLTGAGGLAITALTIASRSGVSFFESQKQPEVTETPVDEQKIPMQPR